MVTDEVADVAVQLVLRLLPDVELDSFRMIMEAVAKEGVEFFGLRKERSARAPAVS